MHCTLQLHFLESLTPPSPPPTRPSSPPSSPPSQAFVSAAETMLRDDVEDNKRIGSFGVSAVQQALKERGVPFENLRVLTHCNTGR